MLAPRRSVASQLLAAAGFTSVFIAPMLLMLSSALNLPFLTFGTVMLVYPLLRVVFGAVPASGPPVWGERVAGLLDGLSAVYCGALMWALALFLFRLSETGLLLKPAIGWALSLWVVLIFATCVAHDLLHRHSKWPRRLGHLLAGVSGYPLLGYEHTRHHRLPGSTGRAEWPCRDETVWAFSGRRLKAIVPEAFGPRGLLFAGGAASPTVRGLRIATAASGATLATFSVAAGWMGAAIYVGTAALVTFALQVITYIQHWSLGDDELSDARTGNYAWESDCRFQAWATLNLSLHQSHHHQMSRPYYRIGLSPNSPRLPMGYVLLMFVASVPPLWRRVMEPALLQWKAEPLRPLSAGRNLTCVALYK